ncbi:uncharacterized protein LOC128392076 [Panonychus citri]|uniref:uncharacterized protein LOC128392076 n=1 Tax=Panonychus citri TaxID=50023 RepID=UPI0023071910|nr:uncharacterized protein LOC128392076 [Panonychus citri]
MSTKRKPRFSVLPSWIGKSAIEKDNQVSGEYISILNTIGLICLFIFNVLVTIPLVWAGFLGIYYSETLAPRVPSISNQLINSQGRPINLTVLTENIIESMIIRINFLSQLLIKICDRLNCSEIITI